MFNGIKNSLKNTKNTTEKATNTIWGMIKGLPNLPWKKLPPLGWAYIIFTLIVFLLIIFVLLPLL